MPTSTKLSLLMSSGMTQSLIALSVSGSYAVFAALSLLVLGVYTVVLSAITSLLTLLFYMLIGGALNYMSCSAGNAMKGKEFGLFLIVVGALGISLIVVSIVPIFFFFFADSGKNLQRELQRLHIEPAGSLQIKTFQTIRERAQEIAVTLRTAPSSMALNIPGHSPALYAFRRETVLVIDIEQAIAFDNDGILRGVIAHEIAHGTGGRLRLRRFLSLAQSAELAARDYESSLWYRAIRWMLNLIPPVANGIAAFFIDHIIRVASWLPSLAKRVTIRLFHPVFTASELAADVLAARVVGHDYMRRCLRLVDARTIGEASDSLHPSIDTRMEAIEQDRVLGTMQ